MKVHGNFVFVADESLVSLHPPPPTHTLVPLTLATAYTPYHAEMASAATLDGIYMCPDRGMFQPS